MVQLKVLSAHQAPVSIEISTFPCVIGRCSTADVRIEAAGVWDEHLCLALDSERRFTAKVLGGALVTLNGIPVQSQLLRNGDTLDVGATKIQFWLGQTRQRNFRILEALTWVALVLVSLGQIALIYAMLR